MPSPRPLDLSSRGAPDQFIFNATAPGLKVLDGRGLLTDALLDGLLGKGTAVGLGGQAEELNAVLRVPRLFAYISRRYASRPECAVVRRSQIQEPKLGGEHNLEPIMVTLPEQDVPDGDPLSLEGLARRRTGRSGG